MPGARAASPRATARDRQHSRRDSLPACRIVSRGTATVGSGHASHDGDGKGCEKTSPTFQYVACASSSFFLVVSWFCMVLRDVHSNDAQGEGPHVSCGSGVSHFGLLRVTFTVSPRAAQWLTVTRVERRHLYSLTQLRDLVMNCGLCAWLCAVGPRAQRVSGRTGAWEPGERLTVCPPRLRLGTSVSCAPRPNQPRDKSESESLCNGLE